MFIGLFTCLVVHRFSCVDLIVHHAVRLSIGPSEAVRALAHRLEQDSPMGAMFRACDLRLGLNFEVRPAADKNFCWRLILEAMCEKIFMTIRV